MGAAAVFETAAETPPTEEKRQQQHADKLQDLSPQARMKADQGHMPCRDV